MDQKFEESARAYAAGEIQFHEFAQATQRQRARWVKSMRRKLWPIPAWHAQADSEQDFLLAIWQQREVPEGYTPGMYFRLGLRQTDKKVQKARGVEQHRRMGKARYERVFSSFARVDDDGQEQERVFDVPVEETQEREAARAEYYAILIQLCTTSMQRAAVRALELTGGGLAAAAAYMFTDKDSCLVCKLDSEEHAARIITRVVDELVQMYGNEQQEEAR